MEGIVFRFLFVIKFVLRPRRMANEGDSRHTRPGEPSYLYPKLGVHEITLDISLLTTSTNTLCQGNKEDQLIISRTLKLKTSW